MPIPDFDLGLAARAIGSQKIPSASFGQIERRLTSKCVIDCIIPPLEKDGRRFPRTDCYVALRESSCESRDD